MPVGIAKVIMLVTSVEFIGFSSRVCQIYQARFIKVIETSDIILVSQLNRVKLVVSAAKS